MRAERGGHTRGRSRPRCSAAAPLALLGALGCVACGDEPIHASLLETPADVTPTEGASEAPFSESHDLLGAPFVEQEPWLDADTTAYAILGRQPETGQLILSLSHHGGHLVADGTTIPTDAWMDLVAEVDPSGEVIYASVEAKGHSLSFDADVLPIPNAPHSYTLDGYFTVDGAAQVWMSLAYLGTWRGEYLPVP